MDFFILFLAFLKGVVITNAAYHYYSKEKQNDNYNEYPKTEISGIKAYKEKLASSYFDCIRYFEKDKGKCKSMNILKMADGQFLCSFFEVADGDFKTNESTTFVSKHQVLCSYIQIVFLFCVSSFYYLFSGYLNLPLSEKVVSAVTRRRISRMNKVVLKT